MQRKCFLIYFILIAANGRIHAVPPCVGIVGGFGGMVAGCFVSGI
jgi:hypothetical protein